MRSVTTSAEAVYAARTLLTTDHSAYLWRRASGTAPGFSPTLPCIPPRLLENVEWLVRAGFRWANAVRRGAMDLWPGQTQNSVASVAVASLQSLLAEQDKSEQAHDAWVHAYDILLLADKLQPWMLNPLEKARDDARPKQAYNYVELLCQLALSFPQELLSMTETFRFDHFDAHQVVDWQIMFLRKLLPVGTLVACPQTKHGSGCLTKAVGRVHSYHTSTDVKPHEASVNELCATVTWDPLVPSMGHHARKRQRLDMSSLCVTLPVPDTLCRSDIVQSTSRCAMDLGTVFQVWVMTWLNQPGRPSHVWVPYADTELHGGWSFEDALLEQGSPQPWRRLAVTHITDIAHFTTVRETDGVIQNWTWRWRAGTDRSPFGSYVTAPLTHGLHAGNCYCTLGAASFALAYLAVQVEDILSFETNLPDDVAAIVADYYN